MACSRDEFHNYARYKSMSFTWKNASKTRPKTSGDGSLSFRSSCCSNLPVYSYTSHDGLLLFCTLLIKPRHGRRDTTYCISALVLRVGSSGRKLRNSSTSFSIDSSCDWSLLRRLGSVERMWFVSCWLRIRWRYGVPIRSAMCLH